MNNLLVLEQAEAIKELAETVYNENMQHITAPAAIQSMKYYTKAADDGQAALEWMNKNYAAIKAAIVAVNALSASMVQMINLEEIDS